MSRVNGTVPEVGAGNWKSPFGRAFVRQQLTDCSTDVIGRDSTELERSVGLAWNWSWRWCVAGRRMNLGHSVSEELTS